MLQATGANGVKLEGGEVMAETVRALVDRGIPVMGHLGLTPQSVNALGGYRVQGRSPAAEGRLVHDAQALEAAGASAIVLELLPTEVARRVTAAVRVPTIGIGAGVGCDGQVLVLHDMLGLSISGRVPKFVKNFMAGQTSIHDALSAYVAEVKGVTFPAAEHGFSA